MTTRTLWSLAWRAARSGYGVEWCWRNCPALYSQASRLYAHTSGDNT